MQPALAANLQLDGIVTLVDAKHITAQLDKRAMHDLM
jgi:G3E family GTPase